MRSTTKEKLNRVTSRLLDRLDTLESAAYVSTARVTIRINDCPKKDRPVVSGTLSMTLHIHEEEM